MVKLGESYWINNEWGYGYRSKQSDPIITNGQYVGCYLGDIGLYDDRDKENEYIFDMGEPIKIILKGDDDDERIPKKFVKWCVDSSSNGTNLNHVNTRCNDNNIAAYPMWVNGMVYIAYYAVADIKPGLYVVFV